MRNLKRALSLALASVMVMGMMVVGSGAASYPDVDAQDNLEAIEVLKAVGVMEGEDGKFNPDRMVTRNEMAVVMVRLLGLTPGGKHPFTDVPAWADPYVAACYNNGIIAGVTPTLFNGSANVTAVQAGLMEMKALGYFGYQGEFYDDWKLSVVKQANEIDLYKGINAYTDQDMTRNEIAQLTLNSLKATVMVVREEGGMNVSGNGISVNQKPRYDKNAADNKAGWDYMGRNGEATMQLCEKLFGKDLRKDADTQDNFGRPATQWTYKGTSAIKTAEAADLTYTDEVSGKTIYEDLGKVSGTNFNIYTASAATRADAAKTAGAWVDGVLDSTAIAINDGDIKIGAKGSLTEVYFDKDTKTATVVVINSYLAQATEDFDADDNEIDVTVKNAAADPKTLSGDDFAVADLKKDDYVLVTLAAGEVETVSPVTMVKNATVSTARYDDYVVADGTKYEFNGVAKDSYSGAVGQALMAGANKFDINGDGYNLFLDPYGYVLGVEGYDAGVNLEDYLFVKAFSTNGFDCIAKVLLMDGTTKTVTVDKIGNADVSASSVITTASHANNFYKFDTDKDGNYELTLVATSGTNVVTQGNATSAVTSAAKPITGLTGNSNTLFIAKDKTYTGVKNAPEIASGTVYYLLNEDGRLMVVYSATAGSAQTSSEDLVYILNNKPAVSKDGDDKFYIYDAIVDGKKTTLEANQDGKAAGVYKIGTMTDGRADLGAALTTGQDALVNVLGTISSADYADGTLTLGTNSYILADGAKIFTIDGNTVKSISPDGVKKAVVTDHFTTATAIEVSSSNDDIVTVYLSK